LFHFYFVGFSFHCSLVSDVVRVMCAAILKQQPKQAHGAEFMLISLALFVIVSLSFMSKL